MKSHHVQEDKATDHSNTFKQASGGSEQPRPKKHRVIIHTSPFLRCIQTSIAVSAGMNEYHGINDNERASPASYQRKNSSRREGDFSRSPAHSATIQEEDESGQNPKNELGRVPEPPIKPRLRLDAFLGEWLSPDYYESITPPPDSVLMLAGAKAELLHRGQYVDFSDDLSQERSSKGTFPGGWGSGRSQLQCSENPVTELEDLSLKSPTRDRASTLGDTGNWSTHEFRRVDRTKKSGAYVAPTPRYAISSADPIPLGYVTHAKDACVEIDYQWDSTRQPQNWGHGGEYGEEWSSMHRRFRKGLQHMIEWYRLHHESAYQVHGHKRVLHPHREEEDDENTDTVLILVTHGAGCNALIGALTNQPVLLDVGMASLTMAVRKDDEHESYGNGTSMHDHSHDDHNLAREYHVLLTASVEHLRAGSYSLSIPLLQQPQKNKIASHDPLSSLPRKLLHRYHLNDSSILTASPIDTFHDSAFALPEPTFNPPSGAGLHRSASSVIRSNSGLWNKPEGNKSPASQPSKTTSIDSQSRSGEDATQIDGTDGTTDSKEMSRSESEKDEITPLGLWSAKSREVQERDRGIKRRWTVNDRA